LLQASLPSLLSKHGFLILSLSTSLIEENLSAVNLLLYQARISHDIDSKLAALME